MTRTRFFIMLLIFWAGVLLCWWVMTPEATGLGPRTQAIHGPAVIQWSWDNLGPFGIPRRRWHYKGDPAHLAPSVEQLRRQATQPAAPGQTQVQPPSTSQ